MPVSLALIVLNKPRSSFSATEAISSILRSLIALASRRALYACLPEVLTLIPLSATIFLKIGSSTIAIRL